MSQRQQLPNLHDAVLERVELSWERGSATIEVTLVPGGTQVLTASGLRDFRMSRRQDWGPSVFINRAEIQQDDGHGITLEIQMQSGDTITAIAAELEVG